MDLMSMTQLLGNLGEFLGALAVVATLFYLIRQVAQNSNQLEIQTQMRFAASLDGTDLAFSRFRELLITNEGVAEIWSKAIADFESLEGTQRIRADQLLFEWFVLFHNFYLRFGQLPEETLGADFLSNLRTLISTDLNHSGIRHWWWENNHRITTPQFVELMSGLIKEQEQKLRDG